MLLFNTLTKRIDDFIPNKPGRATMYSCGPTVYDHIHIGNLRAFISADILRRCLISEGLEVKQVMNFTDVDDKTIDRSQRSYPEDAPETALKTMTLKYEQIFLEDMKAIGNDTDAMQFVKATESIPDIQKLIRKLYKSKFAYIADDGVYFSIKKYRDSGKKYGQLLELNQDNTNESRINNDEYDKESVHDFVLWKLQKNSEPAWEFELDGHKLMGRPGWHIECSAMSAANLGQPFDIHTGGIDLIFPHHENEIAQSTAATNMLYANFFVHNEHLLVHGRKMSKSLNNVFTLIDIQEKKIDPMAFRILSMQAHYRSTLNFSWDNLEAAANRLKTFCAMADLQWQANAISSDQPPYKVIGETLKEHAQNDMNTPEILADISKLAKILETGGVSLVGLIDFKELLKTIDSLLGLTLCKQPDISDFQKKIISDRQEARNQKNWLTTDNIRKELIAQGINIRDTVNGQIWNRM
ncbi:MAG: cysteine--tRNA ligase [Candidatus Saccharibacteria bacterium]